MRTPLIQRRAARPARQVLAMAGAILAWMTLWSMTGRAMAQEQAAAAAPWLTSGTSTVTGTSTGTAKRLGVSLSPGGHHAALGSRVTDLDVAHWRGPRGDASTVPNAALNTVRSGAHWQPARSAVGLEHSALALQLDSGARLSLRARSGGALLVLRNRF